MNRRGFLGALAGFLILPSARTYQRVWKATASGVLVPEIVVGVDLGDADFSFTYLLARDIDEAMGIPKEKWIPMGKLQSWTCGPRSVTVQADEANPHAVRPQAQQEQPSND